MGDWTAAIGILILAVLWIQIFLDYRRKLVRIMPSVTQVHTRKDTISKEITEHEGNVSNIEQFIVNTGKEIESLEEERQELQAKLNPMEMTLIPAGKFRMGTNSPGREDENPEHNVSVTAFYIDTYEVTNLQYKEFIEVTGHRAPAHWRNRTFPEARRANHPVVNVSWDDACAYASWVGKRLPTEAEWERAALGDGRDEYPWGKSTGTETANFDNVDGKTMEVDKFPKGKSTFGVWDMYGNVGEWVSDWYDDKFYDGSPDDNPTGPDTGFQRVFRGGAYHENRMGIRGKSRHFAMPQAISDYIGFRCAMDEEEG